MKKRNSILEINLAAISENAAALQSYLPSSVKHMAVVKANAYGHGAVAVAREITAQVDWFAVNDVQEGIELRENNIELPILVFEPPEPETADSYTEYGLTATISSVDHFSILPDETEYHLLFDTGMGRLGLAKDEIGSVRKLQSKFTELNCTGIYSHFATADKVNSSYMSRQYQLFKEIRAQFKPELLTHICNTGAAAQFADAHFDMVRTGIGIYGYSPGEVPIPELKPALQWKTYLVQVKPIKKGVSVSYGAKWQAPAEGYLGIIPVGYADGLPRRVSDNFQVKIQGKNYPAVGIVTMNYTMVYLKNNRLQAGAEVLLLDEENTVDSWASTAGSISYELLVRISEKIPRIYTH